MFGAGVVLVLFTLFYLWRARAQFIGPATLLVLLAAGALLGVVERWKGEADCRRGWPSGHEVRLTALAADYLPAGVRGSVRFRPRDRECAWAGPLRVWANGPVRPGISYSISGVWQPSLSRGRLPAPPERWGWISANTVDEDSTARRRSPLLRLRGELAAGLWAVYPRRWAPLALALVIGQREAIEPEVSRRIARAGLAHLLAISGLHVGLLASALIGAARILGMGWGRARVAALLLVFAYVILIGAPASALRAALMIFLWTLSRLAGRASSPFSVRRASE